MLSFYSLGVKTMAKKKVEQNENVELKVETPEEAKANLDKSLDVIELGKNKYETSLEEDVEKERNNIFVTYKKARTRNNIIMVSVVVVFVVAMILMVQFKSWGTIVGGVMIGAAVVFMIVQYILTRNTFPNTTKNYIRYFMTRADDYVFDIENVHDLKLYYEKRYALADTMTDRCYKDVIDCSSRNIVTGTYKEKPFECGELALYKAGVKRYQKQVMFVGKYLTVENNLHFEERYIINIKGEKDNDLPNDIEDLKVLSEQNRFIIYGREGANFEKELGKDFIENLKSIECVGSLLNVNIVIWAGKTSAYLSYDDAIVAIPFDKKIQAESYAQLKKNIGDVLEILVG